VFCFNNHFYACVLCFRQSFLSMCVLFQQSFLCMCALFQAIIAKHVCFVSTVIIRECFVSNMRHTQIDVSQFTRHCSVNHVHTFLWKKNTIIHSALLCRIMHSVLCCIMAHKTSNARVCTSKLNTRSSALSLSCLYIVLGCSTPSATVHVTNDISCTRSRSRSRMMY
jgi:hypothetical protein